MYFLQYLLLTRIKRRIIINLRSILFLVQTKIFVILGADFMLIDFKFSINDLTSKYTQVITKQAISKKKKKYDEAITYLINPKMSVYQYNSNLYVYDLNRRRYFPFNKKCFKPGIGEYKRSFCFNAIKDFVEAKIKIEKLLDEWAHEYTENANNNETIKNYIVPPFFKDFFRPWLVEQIYFNSLCRDTVITIENISSIPIFCCAHKCDYPSQKMIEFLFKLSDGDIKKLELLSKLFYNLVYNPTENLTVAILADKAIHKSLKGFFEILFYWHNNEIFKTQNWITFNELYLKDNRALLQRNVFSRTPPVILVKDGCIYKSGKAYSYFKKMLNGKVLKYTTEDFDEEFVVENTIPIVYVTDDEKNFRAMKNLYSSTGIVIHSKDLECFEIGSSEGKWLCNEFMAIGQKGEKCDCNVSENSKITPLEIVEEFLSKYCYFRKNNWISKEKLHTAYKKFVECYYPDETPLTKIVLGKKIKIIKCTQVDDGYRPRQKDENNKRPRGLSGIAINNKFYEEFGDILADDSTDTENEKNNNTAESAKSKNSMHELKLFETLLNSLVDATRKNFVFNTRPVDKTVDLTEVNDNPAVTNLDDRMREKLTREIEVVATQINSDINSSDIDDKTADDTLPENISRITDIIKDYQKTDDTNT